MDKGSDPPQILNKYLTHSNSKIWQILLFP